MKNLETLTAEEMRTMLKNISGILDQDYSGLPFNGDQLQLEHIGLEFFEEGPDPKFPA